MGDRSDEVTESRNRDGRGTDDLLEETDRLLSDSGVGAGEASPENASDRPNSSDEFAGPDLDTDRERKGDANRGPDADGSSSRFAPSSLLSSVTSRLSLGRYFSPKAFLALVLVVGAGLLAGDTVLPIAGRVIGMGAVAFLVGLITSKRRYLEVSAAGVSVGGVAAVLNYAVLIAAGSAGSVVAIGAAVGLLTSLVAYYFGRDLRNGLSRDIG
ncbi:DUF456 domain-containing protein [Natrinema sp. 74]|uniref:DUF456 domain-containing protein n=1 Tax=Natrinema sp. 74 TaxID=3384159 RepID=UPI0038D40537